MNYNLDENIRKMTTLTEKQKLAFDLMVKGCNIFITGPAGTGKSEAIKIFRQAYKNLKTIALTSTTGTSAVIIGGTTIHSYLGIGIGTKSVGAMAKLIMAKNYLKLRWQKLQILIIDEISMLNPELFDKLEEIARIVRCNQLPFGGIQLIISGDFLQLPAINSDYFCFDAESWNTCITKVINLEEIIRQDDIDFKKCLNNIRLGNNTQEVKDIINSRIGVELKNSYGIQPTRLYSLNKDVDYINEQALDELAQDDREFFQYDMVIEHNINNKDRENSVKNLRKTCLAQETLQLCVGAQVMLLHNLDLQNQLANGSRGVVIRFENELPVVKFINGLERIIDLHTWEIEKMDVVQLTASQIPLKPAYAISIHKSQGCSLDCVEIDLSSTFEYGMGYTALSRARSLEGLSIISVDWNKIKTHPRAIEYYNNISEFDINRCPRTHWMQSLSTGDTSCVGARFAF